MCSGSGLDGYTDHQSSWNEVLQNKIELKSTNLQTNRVPGVWQQPS